MSNAPRTASGQSTALRLLHRPTVPVRWAVAEAAVLFLRQSQPGKEYVAQVAQKHGKAQALTVLAHQVGRAVYDLRTREQVFDLQRCVTA